jgi:cell wall-associated NlpC family hydrolase
MFRSSALVAVALAVITALTVGLSPAPASAAGLTPGTRTFGFKVIGEAARHKHDQYRYGATGPHRFDCSGFTKYVLRKAAGKKLPRTAAAQYRATKHIKRSQVRPGDLVFYRTRGGHVFHVGIYAGHGKIWHASNPRTDIKLGKIYNKNWVAGRVR